MFKTFYYYLIKLGFILQPILLLAIRLYWGSEFFKAGSAKLASIYQTSEMFSSLNIPLPTFNAYLVGGIEMVGGLLLLFGFAARLVSLPLIVIMAAAFLTAHSEAFKNMNPSEIVAQPPFTFLLAALIIFCFGPGMFSVDAFLKRFVFRERGTGQGYWTRD